jgi:hypothetical protein
VFVPRTSSTSVATWFWQTEGRSAKRVILGVRSSELLSPSTRIFIGSHRLPPFSSRLIGPSKSKFLGFTRSTLASHISSTDSIPWVHHSWEEGSLDYDGRLVRLQVYLKFNTIIHRQHYVQPIKQHMSNYDDSIKTSPSFDELSGFKLLV